VDLTRPLLGLAGLLAAPAALVAAPDDPRVPWVELQMAGEPRAALAAAESFHEERPEEAARLGASYLRGRLLEELGRLEAAEEAYGDAFSENPELQPYIQQRLALAQEREGHPEVAAGLIADVVDPDLPPDLFVRAAEIFARVIAAGGDCRILHGVLGRRLPDRERRLLRVEEARCALHQGNGMAEAGAILCRLLEEKREDEPARLAAEQLHEILRRRPALRPVLAGEDCDAELELGLTFHQHRHFDLSIPYLEKAVPRLGGGRTVRSDRELEARYALARGYFWREELAIAASRFADLALRARDLEERAEVLYQQARSLELLRDWNAADAAFRRTYQTDRGGELAGPAVLSALRLEWRSGQEAAALHLLGILSRSPEAREYASRAYLFLAVSDIVRGRSDRAAAWLDRAEHLDRESALEADYWRGRLAELGVAGGAAGAADRAVAHYLEAALRDPYHPLAQDARARFASPELAAAAAREAQRRSAAGGSDGLLAAWLLLGDGSLEGRASLRALIARHAAAPATAPFYRLAPVPIQRWPLWEKDLDRAPEMLVALGRFEDGAAAVPRHFPAGEPALAYTGSRLLLRAGRVRESILLADAFSRPVVRRVPEPALPREVRVLLHPYAWGERIEAEARRFGTDPFLLAAVVREESRFDADALSSASARGLTQFVWLTARRIAAAVGLGAIEPHHLYEPRVAITLGAAYLAELQEEHGGSLHQAVAAYNAGPAQAGLWQAYCFGQELPEYYSKIAFAQTRAYVRKVLASRAVYEELYSEPSED
jgi:soluble lytic murein transglycosylase